MLCRHNTLTGLCFSCNPLPPLSFHASYDPSFGEELRQAKDRVFAANVAAVEASEGKKHDQGKPPFNLLPGGALEEVAKVLDFGIGKYGLWNWRQGMAWSRLLGAALRHLFAWQFAGKTPDKESGLSHLAHAACCVLFLLEYEKFNLGTDDRPTHANTPQV